jgi:diacylglycerol diphosphate phosphatase / phosphatidate phosphatase
VLYAPLLGAFLITGALTIDEYHNWYDCLAGATIGSVMATSAYRMVYASIWDFRTNHIPLFRDLAYAYGAGPAGSGGFETAVFTRSGGWGTEEALGGAPFDMAYGLRGTLGGNAFGRPGGAGHGHTRSGDVEHNAGIMGASGAEPRYHHHSRSMERKAVPTGTVGSGSGEYRA